MGLMEAPQEEWVSRLSLALMAPGAPLWLVKEMAAIQDHRDGGIRMLEPWLFTKALQATWIRRLLDPAPQQWKNIV